jgi:hypothetical protein
MKPHQIPLVWDNGRIGSVAADAGGILRLQHAIDDEMEHDLLAKTASGLPTLRSPTIEPADVTALVYELAWPRK